MLVHLLNLLRVLFDMIVKVYFKRGINSRDSCKHISEQITNLDNILIIDILQYIKEMVNLWVKVFRRNPEFRILRLTFIESQPQNAELGRFQWLF